MTTAIHPPPSPTAHTAHTPYPSPHEAHAGEESPAGVFDEIYRKGEWGQPLSSGAGSSDVEAEPYVNLGTGFIFSTKAKLVVDLGCGDGRVLRTLALRHRNVKFAGMECSAEILKTLRNNTKDLDNVVVHEIDFSTVIISRCDLLLCKDVLHHWPNEMVRRFLVTPRGADLIFVADSAKAKDFTDCKLGGYRPLDFRIDPWKEFAERVGVSLVCHYLHKSVWFVPKNA